MIVTAEWFRTLACGLISHAVWTRVVNIRRSSSCCSAACGRLHDSSLILDEEKSLCELFSLHT